MYDNHFIDDFHDFMRTNKTVELFNDLNELNEPGVNPRTEKTYYAF